MDERLLCKAFTPSNDLLEMLPLPACPAAPANAAFDGCRLAPPPVCGARNDAAPQIAMFTPDAESDETIVFSGSGFGTDALHAIGWTAGYNAPQGVFCELEVLSHNDISAAVTSLPFLSDGVLIVWLYNALGASNPVIVNRPALWWCNPDLVHPGETIGLYGRALCRLPDKESTAVFLETAQGTRRLCTLACGPYCVEAVLPRDIAPGAYKIWVHAGYGGMYGWSDSVMVAVEAPCSPARVIDMPAPDEADYAPQIETALSGLRPLERAVLRLPEGLYRLGRQLLLPGGVTLSGAGKDKTELMFDLSSRTDKHFLQATYGYAVTMDQAKASLGFIADVQEDGEYEVWARYKASGNESGCEAGFFKDPVCLRVRAGDSVTEESVYATGYLHYPYWPYPRWARLGTLSLSAGSVSVKVEKVGALTVWLDALVLTRRALRTPTVQNFPLPVSDAETLVIQANAFQTASGCCRFHGDFGVPAIWLTGSHSGVEHLSVSGDSHTDIGVAIGLPWEYPEDDHPTCDVTVRGLRVMNINSKDHLQTDGTYCEINHAGVLVRNGCHVRICDNELCAQAPVLLSGIRQGQIRHNVLCAKRGGNDSALAAIVSRRKTINQTCISDNAITSPKKAGGPTSQRILWVSTGQGAVAENFIARNKAYGRFSGVACCDQNVGESFLFETGNGCAYFGKPIHCTAQSVRIAPDRLVWHVADEQNDGPETIPTQHFVTVLNGKGVGQTRRVVAYDRDNGLLALDRPFLSTPDSESLVVITPLFYRNTVFANELSDTMSGIQFWINGVENVIAENKIKNTRGHGIHMYAYYSRRDENQEPLFNAGIGVEYFNLIAENDIENTRNGIVVQGDALEAVFAGWPVCLGNVVRSNTTRSTRKNAILLNGFTPRREMGKANVGNIAEYNYTIDSANAGVLIQPCNDAAVVRRNHMFIWHEQPERFTPVEQQDGALRTYAENNIYEISN